MYLGRLFVVSIAAKKHWLLNIHISGVHGRKETQDGVCPRGFASIINAELQFVALPQARSRDQHVVVEMHEQPLLCVVITIFVHVVKL